MTFLRCCIHVLKYNHLFFSFGYGLGAIRDVSNHDSRKESNDSATPAVILVVLIICLLGIGVTVFLVVRNRKRKSTDDTVRSLKFLFSSHHEKKLYRSQVCPTNYKPCKHVMLLPICSSHF